MDLAAFFYFFSATATAKHCDFSSWTANKVKLKYVIYTSPKWDDRHPDLSHGSLPQLSPFPATSILGSPPGGGKMRDPGNEFQVADHFE